MNEPSRPPAVTISFSPGALLKFALCLAALALVVHLWSLFLTLVLSVFLAIALNPLVRRVQKILPRGPAILLLTVLIGIVFVGVFSYIIPPVLDQVGRIASKFPSFMTKILSFFPEGTPLHSVAAQTFGHLHLDMNRLEEWMPKLMVVGQTAFGGLTGLLLLYVFMIYFLLDGPRTFEWFVSFFKPREQERLHKSAQRIAPVISAFIIGQCICSLLAATFVYILTSSLGVPAAITLAVMTGIFDILPVVGFFLSAIPNLIFALTVSPGTALIVVAAFACYHVVEAYILVPLLYGNRLRIPGLGVILGLIVGISVGGVVGAIVILPIAATYPILEKIWLKEILGREVIEQHHALETRSEKRAHRNHFFAFFHRKSASHGGAK